MSSILKGLNESNSVYGHSDPDREYGAPATSYGKRGPYYQTDDDDDGNPFAEYERQQRMFAQGRADKAKKEKAQRDADHDRLATGTNEEQLDELSNEKLAKYKTAAAADAGKADLAGDYKKADKRFSGIVKATKKQFANDTKTVKEANGQKEFILYINNKPAAKYIDQLQAERDMASVKKKHPQVRIELKHEVCDLETIKKINENQLMGNALLEAKSLLTQLDESTQQQVINTLKKNVDDEKGAFKSVYPRVNNPKILGTNNKAKSIYYPPSKPNVKKLDKPLPESLGDQLKSKSIEALQQVKQKLEQQRMADLEQWEKDFKQNTVAKFTARQPSFMQQQPKQVAKPLEKHSVLKARLTQLDKAIEKQAILDKMLQRLEAKGLLTPAIQSDTDTSMLVRDGANDNYVSLNQKLDKALEFVKNRLLTNKAAFAKPKAIDEAGTGLDIDRSIPGRTIARVSDKANSVSSKAKTLPSYVDKEDEYDRWSGKTSASTHDDEEDTFDIDYTGDEDGELDENLHQWFKEKWVRFGPDGKIRGDCARGDDSEGKPKCLPQSKAQNLGKKGRASAASRKRREDPNPERSGKAINVNTKKKTNEQELDEACWKGYHKEGNKKMFGKTYPNCVKNTNEEQELNEFAPDGFNGGDDGEEFNPNLAKMAQEDGFTKGASLADGATLQRAMAINDWDKHDGGIYSQHFAKGFKAGRMDKIRHNNKQYNLNLQLMKDGSIRHGEQGVAEDQHSETCPHCGGEMVSEELMNEKKDACYYKVKSRYKVWPSAYASGALVKCRKKGASNWGNGGKSNESIEEGWKEEAQDLEDWSKEVNMRLYRAHESQRPALARQLSKLEQKHFGSEFTHPNLTNVVWSALRALQKGEMVHYDPQRVGQMPFGNIVGDDAKIIAQYNITRDELAGYRMLHDKGMVDNLEQFLKLRRLVRAKSWPLEYYEELEKLSTEEAWLKMANDLNWSKDDMNEEVQAKTDDNLRAYYAQRKAEKQKQQSQSQDQLDEKWSQKYKDSINCSNPKGFSQKAHCAGKQKNESAILKGLK